MKETINYDDFSKLDIRVGEINNAETVENSTKLLKLQVDFGDLGTKQILTGMAKWYNPEDFKGLQTLFVINLEPRKMAGLISEGMMLSAGSDDNSKPVLIQLREEADNGTSVM